MITPCCNKPVPEEVKNVIMPCGKCVFCCEHLHINGYQFPRGTDLTEAFTQILEGNALSDSPTGKVCDSDSAIVDEQSREDGVKKCPRCQEYKKEIRRLKWGRQNEQRH